MPTHSEFSSEAIKQLVADGDTQKAADLLTAWAHQMGSGLDETSVMLEHRLQQLDQEVIEGILNPEDEKVERNKIVKGILQLARQLEKKEAHPNLVDEPIPTRTASEHQFPDTFESPAPPIAPNKNRWLYTGAGALLLLILALFLIHGDSDESTRPNSDRQVEPAIPQKNWNGKVIDQYSKPVEGVILDFGNGLAKDTTDAAGSFSVKIPESAGRQIFVVITHQGKQKEASTIWLSDETLASLKIVR